MSVMPTTVVDRIAITVETALDSDTADALWDLYRPALAALEHRAAARQLLHRGEFDLAVLDERVVKYLARTASGRVVGLCTLSNDLDTVSWISPEFYRTRYPTHVARGAVFYCGIAVVHPDARRTPAFPYMVSALARDVAAADGVLVADMCRYSVDEAHLAKTVTLMTKRVWGSVRHVELDRQLYLAWEPAQRSAAT
jgi:hypothetical protein